MTRRTIVFMLCLAAALNLLPDRLRAAEPDFRGQVVAVRTCDEIAVRAKAKLIAVRIARITCPGRKQPFESGAKHFVRTLLNGRTITLKPVGHDRHRRVWADVFLPDGRSLAYEMVKAGWAHASASAVDERLSELEQDARRAKRGIWDDTQPASGKTKDQAQKTIR